MATTKARTVTVPIPDIDNESTLINAAIEVLEALGFVATSHVVEMETDRDGNARRVARIHCVYEGYMPSALGSVAGVSVSGRSPSTDISAAGINADLRVAVDGAAAVALTIPDPAAFDLGAGAVALNTGARIAQALGLLATAAGLGVTFGYDGVALRYYAYSSTRGASSAVVVTDGLVNDIATGLLLGAANGGLELTGKASVDLAVIELLEYIAPQAIGTTELRDGALAASASGRAKMAAGFFAVGVAASAAHFADGFFTNALVAKFADGLWGAADASRAKFADDFWSGAVALAKFANGFLTAAKLAFEPVMDVGRRGGGTFLFGAGGMAAGETLTLNAAELWTGRAVPDPLLHEFLVTGVAAADSAAFVAAVNAGAGCTVPTLFRAVLLGGDCVAVFPILNATAVALAEATGNVVVSQSIAGVAASDKQLCFGGYTVDAVDVGIWATAPACEVNISGAIPSTSAPTLIASPRLVAAAGTEADPANLIFRFVQSGANEWVLTVRDPAPALLGAGDVLTFVALTN